MQSHAAISTVLLAMNSGRRSHMVVAKGVRDLIETVARFDVALLGMGSTRVNFEE